MAIALNLEKSAQVLQLSLEKAGILKPPAIEVGFGLDVSGSFEDEHRAGITDALLTRLVPWGLAFDPDRKVDVFTFSDGADHVENVGPVDEHNYAGFVPRQVIGKVRGWNGGTDYSYLLDKMLENFGWTTVVRKAGFFGSLLGKKDEIVAGDKKPSVIFIATDGDNRDKARTLQVLRNSQARGDKVYFMFLGISNQGSQFPFLESIGDEFSNTGFLAIPNLRQFVQLSDEELNDKLLTDELLQWFAANGQ